MNTLEKLNAALRYIEENLDGRIDYREVARRAHCSEYHFKRVFSFLAGIPLAEHVRRRRMTLAANDLREGKLRVLDVAVKYGYESADSFSRTFTAIHGAPPGDVRRGSETTTYYAPMTFTLRIQGGNTMEYRIEETNDFSIVGLYRRVKLQFHGVNPEIAAMWKSLEPETIDRLKTLNEVEPTGMISASVNFSSTRMEEEVWTERDVDEALAGYNGKKITARIGHFFCPRGRGGCRGVSEEVSDLLCEGVAPTMMQKKPTQSSYTSFRCPIVTARITNSASKIWQRIR